jgi:rhomboid protease GluP
MFVLSLLLNPGRMGLTLNPLRMLSPSSESLFLLGATGTLPIDHFGRWWTLISANYLHGGILHILFNMFAFKQIASLAAREFGTSRMFIIFTLGGIAGFILSYFAGVRLTIGASAGICALIGASLYYGKSRGGLYGQVIFRQIGGWVVGLFLFGLLIPGINNWGHGGGLLAGAMLGFILGYREKVPESMIHRFLAAACAVVTVLVLLWSIGTGLYLSLIAR